MEAPQNEITAQAVAPLALNKKAACAALGGISETTLWRLEQRGLIHAVPHLRHKLYPIESLRRFVNGKAVAA